MIEVTSVGGQNYSSSRGRDLRQRIMQADAAVAAKSAAGMSLTAAPRMPNNPCATAMRLFEADMTDARFWIGAADRLAAAGNEDSADMAMNEANHYLNQAEGHLQEARDVCA
jgi:hypothetical protein